MAMNVGESPFDTTVDELVAKAMSELHVPGLALAVFDRDKIWSKGYGVTNVDSGSRVTPDTMFSVGSTTKTFTAAAASLLVDDNEEHSDVTWETPMSKLIPDDFVLQDAYATAHVTLEDCLCHRTGLATHRADLGGHSVKENVRNLRHLELTKELRTKWQYSNHMYWAVSHAIEEKSGQDLGTFMSNRLWRPLGMDATFLSIADALDYEKAHPETKLAAPHKWHEESKSFKVMPFWDDVGISGAGGMVSSVSDCAKWIRAFIDKAAPISPDGYSALTSAHMIQKASHSRFTGPVCYGLGWFMSVYHGERVLWHPGGLVGSVSSFIYLPERKWGIVGMCNVTSEQAIEAPMWHLIDELLSVPREKRTDVVAKAVAELQDMKAFSKGAKGIMFPGRPETPKPSSAPISTYCATYSHPSYGSIIVDNTEDKAVLKGAFPGRLPLDPLFLEHIDGDNFLLKADIIELIPVRAKAKLEIDETGVPDKLGVEFGDSITTWFCRMK
ncbi:serine beta-lactamase-like superfamily protein [Grosmannia clavigera kw1407]|uniref:Serine beta-lactamase-like superfamily protein n=1 Tax=Grosmannia clavigera (strain kw1407 / UAMH 11150) TaxID=655863 RepID=F0XCT6_GROCL|nr:serine beta-lactamase-like superfamily protein [Grosmannia clavigera kw1407]EFX03953.1 serine beta-lactamase-like superfamily protein [Grosmannia clavigera kw1407]